MLLFSHPLARGAKVWSSTSRDGSARKLLVVVTTLELDPGNKRYKTDKVSRLEDAAREWLSDQTDDVDGYVFVNRFRDWNVGGET